MVKYLVIILVLALPFQFALNIGDNFDLTVTRVTVPLIFFLWLVRGLVKKEVWIPNKTETWLLLLFLFFLVLSLLLGNDAGKGFRKLIYFLSVIPLFWVASDLLREERFRKKVLKAIIISGTLAAILGIIQFFLQFIIGLDAELKYTQILSPYFLGQSFGSLVENNSSWLVNVSGKTLMRSFGFFPDPHSFSVFVSLGFFATLGYVFFEKKNAFRLFAIFGMLMMFLAVMLSFARGAYLGLLAGIIFFAAALAWEKKWFGKILVVFGMLIVAIVLFNPSAVSQRFSSAFDLREGSNAERIKNWKQGAEIVVSHPLLGVGLGNYASQIDPTVGERSSIYAHNTFLDLAAETGVANGLVFLALPFVSILRFLKTKSSLGVSLAASLVYFLVHGIFDTPLWSPQVMVILLVILALGASQFPEPKIVEAGLGQTEN
jgi:O-antigen ligase